MNYNIQMSHSKLCYVSSAICTLCYTSVIYYMYNLSHFRREFPSHVVLYVDISQVHKPYAVHLVMCFIVKWISLLHIPRICLHVLFKE